MNDARIHRISLTISLVDRRGNHRRAHEGGQGWPWPPPLMAVEGVDFSAFVLLSFLFLVLLFDLEVNPPTLILPPT